ncbi:unnamed protein product, partial [Amoebophrya sp. A25]|eukprot:GSA25T00019733001.1
MRKIMYLRTQSFLVLFWGSVCGRGHVDSREDPRAKSPKLMRGHRDERDAATTSVGSSRSSSSTSRKKKEKDLEDLGGDDSVAAVLVVDLDDVEPSDSVASQIVAGDDGGDFTTTRSLQYDNYWTPSRA